MSDLLRDFDFLSVISPSDFSQIWTNSFWSDFLFSDSIPYFVVVVVLVSFVFVLASALLWWGLSIMKTLFVDGFR